MSSELERRSVGTAEYRAGSSDSPPKLVGYALKYDKLSQDLGGFVERVAPGAVDKSLADQLDVLARYNHDDNHLLGRVGSGTLQLASDDTGLWYEVDLPETQQGRDVATLAARGDVSHSSFAFYTLEDDWWETEQGYPLRTLKQIRLVDVAPVNTPAYLDTSTAVRSLATRLHVDPDQVLDLDPTVVAQQLAHPMGQGADGEQRDTHSPKARTRFRLAELDLRRRGWQREPHPAHPRNPSQEEEPTDVH